MKPWIQNPASQNQTKRTGETLSLEQCDPKLTSSTNIIVRLSRALCWKLKGAATIGNPPVGGLTPWQPRGWADVTQNTGPEAWVQVLAVAPSQSLPIFSLSGLSFPPTHVLDLPGFTSPESPGPALLR